MPCAGIEPKAYPPTQDPWRVVLSRPNHEFAVRMLLGMRFDAYLPVYRTLDSSRHIKQRSLFPGYVFCRFPWERRGDVLATASVREQGILRFGDDVAIVTEQEMAQVRELESMDARPVSDEVIAEGDEVDICIGVAKMRGRFLSSVDDVALVTIDGLQRSVAVRVDRGMVRKAA